MNRAPPKRLCKICLAIFTSIRSAPAGSWIGSKPRSFGYPESSYLWGGSHHTLPGSFLSSVKIGCYICSIIFRDCNDSQRELAKSFQIFYRLYELRDGSAYDGMIRFGLRFGIEVEQNNQDALGEFFYDCQGDFKVLPFKGPLKLLLLVTALAVTQTYSNVLIDIESCVKRHKVPANTSDPKCLELAQTWLMECASSHKVCQRSANDQQFYPTRLLNLDDALDGASCRLQNCATEPPSGPYCTLSHCWGKGEFLKLTTVTLHELELGISISSLSRTFQDAIRAARSLGVRYLWIDALCIIQDSSEDWKNEAARMAEVYTKSYCNIAATAASNGEGCFVVRDACGVEPCLIESSIFVRDATGAYVIAYDDFWSINLRNAPLHQRGWVLQERLLSPRTIHFGSEQLFWECQYHTACESYPGGIPTQLKNPRTKAWRLFDSLLTRNEVSVAPNVDVGQSKLSMLYETWSETVEWYTECKITIQSDKLVAIAGIAHTVAEFTGERYLAGLWENQDLAIQLLWHVLSRRQADNSPSQRADFYRAPSWSWACLEATVVWNWPTSYDKTLVSVVDATVVAQSTDNMCEISDAALRIRGCLFEAKLEVAHVRANGAIDEDGDYNLQVDYDEIHEDGTVVPLVFSIARPVVHLDTAMMPIYVQAVYCLPVCTGWAGKPGCKIAGLLLVQDPQVENRYSRIGIFGLNQTEACHFCGIDVDQPDRIEDVLREMPTQTITII
jgi:hypothetical protein